jgi:hypothetical protein
MTKNVKKGRFSEKNGEGLERYLPDAFEELLKGYEGKELTNREKE